MGKSMRELPFHLGVKLRIYPSSQQKSIITLNSDASRFLYNKLVETGRELYRLRQVKLPIEQLLQRIETLEVRLKEPAKYLSNLHSWLNQAGIDRDMKDTVVANYRAAWRNFRNIPGVGIPTFHKKGYEQRYQSTTHYKSKNGEPSMFNGTVRLLDQKHLFLGKLGRIRIAGLPSKIWQMAQDIRIGTITIKRDAAGHYYVGLMLASTQPFVSSSESTNHQLGIDLNLKNFMTDSDGKVVENPRYLKQSVERLAKLQRVLSRRARNAKASGRKLSESKNYQKQRIKVAKLHRHVAEQRRDFQQKLSTEILKTADLIAIEALSVPKMLKQPSLSFSISDAGWGEFSKMLRYKCDLLGKQFVRVDPRNTTQTCHLCGFVMGTGNSVRLGLNVREWTCPNCHMRLNRDQNAAINVLNRGQQMLSELAN